MFEMFEMLPTDDMKSWAFRLAHYGVMGGFLAFAIVVALLLQNTYLVVSLRAIRAQLHDVESKLSRRGK
jgi:nitrate/nitrite transporter NarK